MRLENWRPEVFDDYLLITYEGLLEMAYQIKDRAVQRLRSHIGSGKTTGISRPVYKKGKYAGEFWTAREFGNLLKSIRVVEKTDKSGMIKEKFNVRVYAGTKMAFYASIFESSKPFLRPALRNESAKIVPYIQGKINRGERPKGGLYRGAGPGHGHG